MSHAEHFDPREPGKSTLSSAEMHYFDESQITDDGPAPVPGPIARRLPRFDNCGVSHCHDHHHSGDDIKQMVSQSTAILKSADQDARSHNERTARNIDIIGKDVCWPLAACRDCRRLALVVGLHRLDCGHALCHDCLTKAATRFCRVMEDSDAGEGIRGLLEEGRDWVREAKAAVDPRQMRECEGLARNYINDAYFEAQASCCNMHIDFTRFAQCLNSQDACAVWLACDEMRTASTIRTRYECGWPDCRKYLPARFLWRSEGRFYGRCLSCGGNSKEQGDGVMCPAR